MSKKNRQKNFKNSSKNRFEEKNFEPRLHAETKKSILAVVFLGVAAVLILASFNNAGPFGNFLYKIFEKLFGWGYYLLPLIFFIMSGFFFASKDQKINSITFLGAAIFVLSGLGLIDILFSGNGGFVGDIVGAVEIPFGYAASIIIIAVLIAASLLTTFNFPIRLDTFRKKGSEEGGEDEQISAAVASADAQQKPEPEKQKAQDEIKNLETKEFEQKSFLKSTNLKTEHSKLKAKGYIAPPLDLLKSSVEKPTSGDLRANVNIIKRTLESFGIPVEMGEINIGPKITRYTLKPAEGVKLSRITALNQDLSMALAAHPIRIEAPIPGKSLVGIEVPNKASAVVRLGNLMSYPDFSNFGPMGFVLGRDVNGEPIFSDIAKLPHLLIAGTTGSGKSIMIHSLLTSLLYRNSPETLRLILIDPKRVELSLYSGLPHLVSPVITEPKKALGVFKWTINEMERRYEIFVKSGSRDIQSYNKKNIEEPLPCILIVVDELADLMFSYSREIESSVVRLAQMARATGIHLVLSTQRPSVEVVTGLIKANISARVALQLPSQVDSRTILDSSGAEKLLGGGDMLYISSESSKPKRIQGAYISEEEVKKVTEFIRENNKDFWFKEEIPNFPENGGNGNEPMGAISMELLDKFYSDEEDDLYEEAIEVVKRAKKASASLLQRRLKVGYARAARLLDIMEAKGIIGPGDGAKPRDVYLSE
ncbi:MAG: DNA translocase FtsK [Spirochaetia bacterium]|nr:MAG: DNA translocase FtsK [Spirochaetia bacterium]